MAPLNYFDVLTELLRGAGVTVVVSLGAWIFGIVLGLGLAVIRGSSTPLLLHPTGFIVITLRSLPPLIVIYLIYFGLAGAGIDVSSVVSAIIALGLVEAAFMAEYYKASFLTVLETQRDAGLSLGLSSREVFRYVVLPQAVPYLVPPTLNSYVGLLKGATLASAVGAPEILYRGQNIINRSGHLLEVAATIVVLYVVVTLPLTYVVSLLERRAQAFRRARAG